MPPQPPASRRHVLAGVALAMAIAAVPFAFKTVRQREEQVRQSVHTSVWLCCVAGFPELTSHEHLRNAGARHAGRQLRQGRGPKRAASRPDAVAQQKSSCVVFVCQYRRLLTFLR